MTVKIVTDSTSDIPPSLAEELGITVVPLNVHFGTDVFKDGIDIKPDEFYGKLVSSSRLPTTSQPSVGDFLSIYDELGKEHKEIVSIHISGKLSGTLNSATQAKEQYSGDARIEAIDSKHGSIGLAMVALAAYKAASDGLGLDDVIKEIQSAINEVEFFALVDTLEYLEKGGRIGKAQAFMGSMLKIKPILTVRDGEVFPLEKIRSRNKGIDRICELVKSCLPVSGMCVAYTTTPDDAKDLSDRLQELIPNEKIILSQVGPVVGTHSGPGVLAVALRKG